MELLLIIPIVIWVASIYMLSGWDKFNKFFIANGILIIVYVGILIYGKSIWGHDEYGLGFLFRLTICLLTHVLIVFVFAVVKNLRIIDHCTFFGINLRNVMRLNSKCKKSIWTFALIAPVLIFLSLFVQIKLPANQGEFPESISFLIFALLVMVLNTISIVTLWIFDFKNMRRKKLLNAYSIFLGTPVLILLMFAYGNTLSMRINLYEPQYLRNGCFMKWKNIYKAKNRYHYTLGYCPTATQDSIIVTEIYRWGKVKSCGVILDGKYTELDTSEIMFLTANQKKEIMSY